MRNRTAANPAVTKRFIYEAISTGDSTSLKKNIESLSSINQPIRHRLSALHLAASAGQYHMAFYLLGKGADVNLSDPQNNLPSPLQLALENQFYEVAALLIISGAVLPEAYPVRDRLDVIIRNLIPVALHQALELELYPLFDPITRYALALNADERKALPDQLMPIARLAAQQNAQDPLRCLARVLNPENVVESTEHRPVFYWLIVKNPENLPGDLAAQFSTPESRSITLAFLSRDSLYELYTKHHRDDEAASLPDVTLAHQDGLPHFAAIANKDMLKISLQKARKNQLFDEMVRAYDYRDLVAFNTLRSFFKVEDVIGSLWALTRNYSHGLLFYFTLLSPNVFPVMERYIKAGELTALDHRMGRYGMLELVFLQGHLSALNALRSRLGAHLGVEEITQRLQTHLMMHYNLPGTFSELTDSQKSLLAKQSEKWQLPVPDGVKSIEDASDFGKFKFKDYWALKYLHGFLDPKMKGRLAVTNKANCDFERKAMRGVDQLIAEETAKIEALQKAIVSLEEATPYFATKLGVISACALLGFMIYCSIYTDSHSYMKRCNKPVALDDHNPDGVDDGDDWHINCDGAHSSDQGNSTKYHHYPAYPGVAAWTLAGAISSGAFVLCVLPGIGECLVFDGGNPLSHTELEALCDHPENMDLHRVAGQRSRAIDAMRERIDKIESDLYPLLLRSGKRKAATPTPGGRLGAEIGHGGMDYAGVSAPPLTQSSALFADRGGAQGDGAGAADSDDLFRPLLHDAVTELV